MKALARRKALALLFAFLAGAAHAACEPGGMGGTGIRAEADVGIIGVITGFGSICVNGIEVQYDSSTPVSDGGAVSSPAALALGQLVAVRALGNGVQARARDIQILDALVGRAASVDPASGALQVAGQRVELGANTVIGAELAGTDLAGQNLRVSGLWRRDGTLAATRIERASADAAPHVGARDWPDLGTRQLIVEGYVADVRADTVRIGGLAFAAAPALAAGLERDRRVRASGRVERPGVRVVERVEVERIEQERPQHGGADRTDRGGADRPDRGEHRGPGREERPERIERPERGDRVERPERIERLDRSGPH